MNSINENPMIRTYLYNAYVESVLSNHKDYKHWLANNYIQCYAKRNIENQLAITDYMAGTIFGGCKLIDYQYYTERAKLEENEEYMIQTLTQLLDANKVIYLFLDEFYVENRTSYQKLHFVHDALIVNRVEDGFEYLGYDNIGNYRKTVIGCKELFQALHNDNKCCFLIGLNNEEYHFDIHKFITMLKEYVYAIDSRNNLELYFDITPAQYSFFANRFAQELDFGINMYDTVVRLFEYYDREDVEIDWRVLHFVHEHKLCMAQKISYLIEEGYMEQDDSIVEQYQGVIELAKKLENIGLKYIATRSKKISKKIIDLLIEMKEMEKSILLNLLEILINTYENERKEDKLNG